MSWAEGAEEGAEAEGRVSPGADTARVGGAKAAVIGSNDTTEETD